VRFAVEKYCETQQKLLGYQAEISLTWAQNKIRLKCFGEGFIRLVKRASKTDF